MLVTNDDLGPSLAVVFAGANGVETTTDKGLLVDVVDEVEEEEDEDDDDDDELDEDEIDAINEDDEDNELDVDDEY